MTDTCRAALWYDSDVTIKNSKLHGIKALRECDRSTLIGCDIISPEFGWFDRGVNIQDCTLQAEYAFMHSRDMDIKGLHMTGKYSFQYVQDVVIRDSVLDTKDAFWHSKNVTVYDSVVQGGIPRLVQRGADPHPLQDLGDPAALLLQEPDPHRLRNGGGGLRL